MGESNVSSVRGGQYVQILHILQKNESFFYEKDELYTRKAEELASIFGVSKDVVNSFRYVDNPNLGKVLNVKYDKEEPVMDIVKEKDVEIGGIAVDRLRSLIERIERLEEEKKGIQSDVRDVFAEAKGAGFDVKIMKAVIKLRKMNAADRDEAEILLDTYCRALDM